MEKLNLTLECGEMPNVMAALSNIGGTLCSTPQSLADAHYQMPCSNAAKTRNQMKFAGVPQTCQQISAVRGRSSPYYEHVWTRYRCLTSSFFGFSIHVLAAKIQPNKVVRWCQNGDFLHPVFSASRVQHISDMHSKFALRPHHVRKYGRHPISNH